MNKLCKIKILYKLKQSKQKAWKIMKLEIKNKSKDKQYYKISNNNRNNER